jgi:hypothetical protein
MPIEIQSFDPTEGPPGTRVTVQMSKIVGGDPSVVFAYLGDRLVGWTFVDGRTVEFEVSADANTGLIRVIRQQSPFNGEGIDSTSATPFEVTADPQNPPAGDDLPVLTGFQGGSVAPNGIATVYGENLTKLVMIRVNFQQAPFIAGRTDTRLRFRAPAQPGQYRVIGYDADNRRYPCPNLLTVSNGE